QWPMSDSIGIDLMAYQPDLADRPVLSTAQSKPLPPNLAKLEAESIYIIREAVAAATNPAILYSIGKDSSVLLHLALKAFAPGKAPLSLLHVDTRWKFREMYDFRDAVARQAELEMNIHINPAAIENDINPFDHGSSVH